ncbi:MAG: hypothetical protein ACTSV3_04625 [Candidatus Thorarchaeota archaeon]|nr:MAG: hypothetical protein DRP09_01520 [Candidatus Thorarchaeota archaeon]
MTKRSRTVTFPRYSLQKCEERILQFPPAKALSRIDLLERMGYTNHTSGPAGSAIGALVMFGLIQNINNNYELTSIGKALRNPVSTSQQNLHRMISWLLPEKFQSIYAALKGRQIRSGNQITSMVIQRYPVSDDVAKQFERVFIESGVYASTIRVLPENGYTIANLDALFAFLGQEPKSLKYPSEDVLDRTLNEASCAKVLQSVNQSFTQDSEENETEASKDLSSEPIELASAVSGHYDFIQFKMSDGQYIVSTLDLKEFVRKAGKKISTEIYEIDE